MQALRKIQIANTDYISFKIPKAFMKRSLEIIIMPLDEPKPLVEPSPAWPKDFFAKTSGCFAGEPLIRENQGEYEVRDMLL